MLCDDCGAVIDHKGLLINTKDYTKTWLCVECFVKRFIAGDATIIHHWGITEKKAAEELKPEDD